MANELHTLKIGNTSYPVVPQQVYLTGKADNVNYPLVFATAIGSSTAGSASNQTLLTDTANSLYYNPSTNALTASKFIGALEGKASSATVADSAGTASSVAWTGVTGKPTTFTPSEHTHSYLPLSGGTLTGNLVIGENAIVFNRVTSASWVNTANSGIRILNSIGSAGEEAPSNYGVGLSVSGCYGFQLALAHSASSFDFKMRSTRNGVDTPYDWVSLIHSGNIGSQYVKGFVQVGANANGRYDANELVNGGILVNSESYSKWDNAPTGANVGALIHFAPSGNKLYSLQMFVDGANEKLSVRNCLLTQAWSAWKTIAFTSDIPTSLPASDVYAWAKASTKPSYTAAEVGALSTSGGTINGLLSIRRSPSVISFETADGSPRGCLGIVAAGPAYYDADSVGYDIFHSGNLKNVSQLTNDSGYITRHVNTNTNSTPFIISRSGSSRESVSIGINDSQCLFRYENDELSNAFAFEMYNSGSESGATDSANTSQVFFRGSSSGSVVEANYFNGTFNGNCTGNANTATNASKVNGYSITTVTSLPSSPDANTIYFIT